ncbi:hypothetical protein PUR34_26720 [Streptomyces sp. JV185]|uniref:hypothetical protein n=1 Tax=Streptomyces sp. JV185 TaxID=858638 RepID=UPI002E76DDA0|nr:hypothetical protein [Streptomyces sp. JV185]MEE1771648.1 hypothetical protein [Streptomyces sp. JV185]
MDHRDPAARRPRRPVRDHLAVTVVCLAGFAVRENVASAPISAIGVLAALVMRDTEAEPAAAEEAELVA